MVAGAVEDENGVSARSDLATDFGKMQGHYLGVGGRRDDGRGRAAFRADGAEDVGPFVALIARRAGSGPTLGPDAGQRALLADPRFILEPYLDGLFLGAGGESLFNRRGEVFLKSSWAASSVCG